MNSSGLLDDVFALLELATKLESTSRIEAATKYYEAIYLMKRYIERGSPVLYGTSTDGVSNLITEKIQYYETVAKSLLDDQSNKESGETFYYNPRSPISKDDCTPIKTNSSIGCIEDQLSVKSADSVFINTTSNKANKLLARALDLDENGKAEASVSVYIEASEAFLSAIQAAERMYKQGHLRVEPISNILKRRLSQTLDRVEQLKKQIKLSKERKIPSQTPTTPRQKRSVDNFSTVSKQSHLTPSEVAILKNSSIMTSGLFLPWSDTDAAQLFNDVVVYKRGDQLFTDPDGFLSLSSKQRERFHRWARPTEIVQLRYKSGLTRTMQTPIVVKSISPYTIKQQYVTDCSFIASLCICAAFEGRFRRRIITSILHPQSEDGVIQYNPQGKYMVKLWLNGVARSVVIDDYFPVDQYGNLLCSHTSLNQNKVNPKIGEPHLELWVCLIEKAYMKLCGGYDFPGSNSGVDLFSLTGWIPERIIFAKDAQKVKDFEIHPERAFERIFSASSFGDCLITVSTDLQLTESEADAIGLVTGHAYAVLDVIQTKNGTRLLQLKNPWAHKSWKGRFSSRDLTSWKDRSLREEVGYDPDFSRQNDDGVFWVCWEDVLNFFQNFHLSWNPGLFKFRLVTHGFWPAEQAPSDDTFNVGENPQYILNFSKDAINQKATIWILISRHVSKQEQEGAEVNDYLTVHLHRNNGQDDRIWYPGKSGGCVLSGVYTNNPHVLIRYDLEGSQDAHLSVVLSQYKKANDLGYTLSCFCTENFALGKPREFLPRLLNLTSSWTLRLSGGPVGRPTFPNNPMFSILIPEKDSFIQVTVSTSTTSAVNVLLLPVAKYGDGVEKATGDALLDSGNYRHGFIATKVVRVKGGPYVMIVSNFHKGDLATFKLQIFSTVNIRVEQMNLGN